MDEPTCAVCNEPILDEDYASLDNGSPAHTWCVEYAEKENEE